MSKQKSVVLLSSGLDSTVNLYLAKEKTEVLLALTFHYGQRAAEKELLQAKKIAAALQIPHQIIDLPFFKNFGNSSLINEKFQIPVSEQIQIDHLQTSEASAKSVWVPNRNGIFLNIAAGFAETLGAQLLIPGFNLEEAATFPDNTQAYLDSLTKSFSYSTANQIQANCFTTDLNKTEIVAEGIRLGVDWSLTWPCYFAQDQWCGVCESCQRAKRAFQKNNLNMEGQFLK